MKKRRVTARCPPAIGGNHLKEALPEAKPSQGGKDRKVIRQRCRALALAIENALATKSQHLGYAACWLEDLKYCSGR